MRTAPEVYCDKGRGREGALGAGRGRPRRLQPDCGYRALVLLATFASLRWGEATALRRCDMDLRAGTVRSARLRRAVKRSIVLGPPKSKAGRRMVGFPTVIIPALREHLSVFVGPARCAGLSRRQGRPLRRGNFNKLRAGRTRCGHRRGGSALP